MSVQKTEEGAFLHICSFPDFLVPLFVETHIEVVERNTNTSLYKRTVCVEDHCKTFVLTAFTHTAVTGMKKRLILAGGKKENTHMTGTCHQKSILQSNLYV